MRGAFASRADERRSMKRRKRGSTFAIARKFESIDAGQNFGSVVMGWAD